LLVPGADATEQQLRDDELRALVKSLATGDQNALTAFYDRTSRIVYGLALRILSDAATAEEVVLDVYMQVWRQARRYDAGRGGPLAWLVTIARSRALDRLRSASRENLRKEPLDLSVVAASAVNVEDGAAVSETQQTVRVALDGLPAEQREVIELAYYAGMSHSEIAATLRQPLGTVKTRVRLAMTKLRAALKPSFQGTP
jgi:RNA polymerase sigma-70 factor (ECF subfamily)